MERGTIQAIRPEADFSWVTVSYPGGLAPLLIHRGSVAVDGISLTVARLEAKTFDVQIVPFTWMHTNLRAARVGDLVNLECDMVGKYVVRALETMMVRQELRCEECNSTRISTKMEPVKGSP